MLAQTLCEPRSSRAAFLELTRLAFDIQLAPLVTVLAKMPHVRRCAAASGDPHVLALLRIYVARCEARVNGLAEVRRHHRVVLELLKAYPNRWLEGLVEVDRSVIELLTGDTDKARTSAELALAHSQESGHFHTYVAAHINLSHIQERRGDFERARAHINTVIPIVDSNCHLRRAVRDSWANLLITAGDYENDAAPFWTMLHYGLRMKRTRDRAGT